ncbi:MAG: polysaccharide deacetylase family protein [Sediminibacterium sp.]|uniref:polysaccharide deacetylase family protein n=1 Tax=Sediminibacterium sp. TaxID=1917865 RepID=UPI002725ACDB|nr:polysaccharide deacetylase family protein [Sediminibacterium sp.]MDO8996426.1 polysaccharide deacetylase family protein [Sediminibacterium sp.]
MYLVKTPWWLRMIYSGYTWRMPSTEKTIYLSFDDGPHEIATPFVLDTLKQYNAKASFFCIGKNVRLHPEIYQRILQEGHAVGNHTENHLNGWHTPNNEYLNNIQQAEEVIQSNLFRPPYGRIKRSQAKALNKQIIMWDVLSGDFDPTLTPEACLAYCIKHTEAGSIVVFHDSAKAFPKMKYALPKMLDYFTHQGFQFKAL